ncbi:putative restriction enzyme [Bacillus methanolicus PB1]|uniref:site-specific DNA-methyltransferase (adenine-specific) n=1 Tax=Bacillus methanolicus PB1 TaxID=997296 RepID=I3E467_BACMT|nr:BREX-1 system adenine-specific DNA-methyltransferase PglX [Bacillus methanolicus]EIJ81288.1 putative restriction enzyme [Bacillus methanolicus PB1]
MNKSALKNFATNARRELLEKIKTKANLIGITETAIKKAEIESSDAIFIDGKPLSSSEKAKRNKLIQRIQQLSVGRTQEDAYKMVMEEVAYTWFNRFTALRFMEVNEYLPSKVRVLSSYNPDNHEPDIVTEALSVDLDIDKDYVAELKLNNKTEELFKYMIIKQCNDLNKYLPFMFEKIDDYTEILFPDGLLNKDSFIRKMTDTNIIPEEDWKQVEIIGWLYQYYIAEEKDRVIKAKKKYKTEEIPYATQLFTPDWIVRYMVQNSLGRYWIESHPEHRDLLKNWEFFLENPNPEPDFEEKLVPYINKEMKVEEIKCFDPAMGSGHILVYMFDVLYEIYRRCGYMEREIPRLIIEKNLYGLDIDDRAYQLASFSLVMKALEYNKRFLRSVERDGLTLNLASIQETNILTDEDIAYLAGEDYGKKYEKTKLFMEQFQDAKTIGSLLKVTVHDTTFLQERLEAIKITPETDLFETEKREKILSLLPKLIKQAYVMGHIFDVLVTNPPYMGSGNMNAVLSSFLKEHYPDSKSDLFGAFMELDHYLKKNGFYASINQHSWMFLSSFEKLRKKIIQNKLIENMLHLGPRAFEEIGGEVVQSTAFVLRNAYIPSIKGTYVRLIDERTAREKNEKAIEAVQNPFVSYRYSFNQKNFNKIPGSPIAFWVSKKFIGSFVQGKQFGEFGVTKKGILTGNDKRFIRLWYEVNVNKIGFNTSNYEEMKKSNNKWFPITAGGLFRKWYGNFESVVNLENDAYEVKFDNKNNFRLRENSYYFLEGLTWTEVSSKLFSLRYVPQGILFGNGGPTCFVKDDIYYFIALLNSKVAKEILRILAPTINFGPEQIKKIPCIVDEKKEVEELSKNCINLSMLDWDNFETSWDFKKHPLMKYPSPKIESAFNSWKQFSKSQFNQLKSNEEELNRIFIEIYGLQDELTPEVDEADVTIRKADLERDIKSFISYAIGCSFGRYSLDEDGLIYAGGEFDASRYKKFPVVQDNIMSILPGAYFEDDIISRFVNFVKVTFGEENLAENLDFIANTLGKKKGETAKETIRRYFLNDFFKDHVQTYKKRPIYWLFTSGKQKAFNCLIYMHRYDKTTLSRIRTNYLHELQFRMDAEKKSLLCIIEGDSTAKEISNAKKELKALEKKIDELKEYDELLHHMADQQIEIDLDDGVVVNYAKFEGLVAPIK